LLFAILIINRENEDDAEEPINSVHIYCLPNVWTESLMQSLYDENRQVVSF